jgi:hypothetical protein
LIHWTSTLKLGIWYGTTAKENSSHQSKAERGSFLQLIKTSLGDKKGGSGGGHLHLQFYKEIIWSARGISLHLQHSIRSDQRTSFPAPCRCTLCLNGGRENLSLFLQKKLRASSSVSVWAISENFICMVLSEFKIEPYCSTGSAPQGTCQRDIAFCTRVCRSGMKQESLEAGGVLK